MSDSLPFGYYVGQSARLKRTFSAGDVEAFSRLTGDTNPLHLDEEYAERTRFRRRIVNGGLISSLIGSLMGRDLPGPGTVLLTKELSFFAPLYLGEELTVELEVKEVVVDKNLLRLELRCIKAGEIIAQGHALVIAPEVNSES